jgi:hypothetical protein
MKRLIIAGLCIPLLCAAASSQKPVDEQLLACRALPSRDARTDCYDHLADAVAAARAQSAAAPMNMEKAPAAALASPQPQAPSAAPQTLTQTSAAALPAPSAPAQSAQPGEQAKSDHSIPGWGVGALLSGPKGASFSITQVGSNDSGRLRIVTADGITWDQSDDLAIRTWPKPGDSVKISKSVLGYWCRLGERDLYHCKPEKIRAD